MFDSVGRELKDTVHAWWPRPGGWQTLEVRHGLWRDGHLSALVGWTGAPACVADVHDGDVALVAGLGTDGRSWRAWLKPDVAAAFLTPGPEDQDDTSLWEGTAEFEEAVKRKRAELEAEIPVGAEGAIRWAAAAGIPVTAPRSRIEKLLRSRETFVEDVFSMLLDELGFPRAVQPSPES
ncbi:hypothetical protein [Streptomyces sp. NPDC002566]|uniref:hypothetical protein n=1 Tax=Streptomyces sp. NPDC002566 TaxID=3364650 RepID=UPI0036BC1600